MPFINVSSFLQASIFSEFYLIKKILLTANDYWIPLLVYFLITKTHLYSDVNLADWLIRNNPSVEIVLKTLTIYTFYSSQLRVMN
jgi:hypothetical protein